MWSITYSNLSELPLDTIAISKYLNLPVSRSINLFFHQSFFLIGISLVVFAIIPSNTSFLRARFKTFAINYSSIDSIFFLFLLLFGFCSSMTSSMDTVSPSTISA